MTLKQEHIDALNEEKPVRASLLLNEILEVLKQIRDKS